MSQNIALIYFRILEIYSKPCQTSRWSFLRKYELLYLEYFIQSQIFYLMLNLVVVNLILLGISVRCQVSAGSQCLGRFLILRLITDGHTVPVLNLNHKVKKGYMCLGLHAKKIRVDRQEGRQDFFKNCSFIIIFFLYKKHMEH